VRWFNSVVFWPAFQICFTNHVSFGLLDSRTAQAHQGTDRTELILVVFAEIGLVERASQFVVGYWHSVILSLHLFDYSRTDANGKELMAPLNPGPCYTARAFAMGHLAMYDAYVGISQDAVTYLSYSEADIPAEIPGTLLPPLMSCDQ
jgi:hypothetical protein